MYNYLTIYDFIQRTIYLYSLTRHKFHRMDIILPSFKTVDVLGMMYKIVV